jgi:hypothetical protein
MASETGRQISDLINARVKIEFLEQDLSNALQLFYGCLCWILTVAPAEFEPKIKSVIRAKILQLPQGCPLGQSLIELDRLFGGLLETTGVLLSRWVYEPREKGNDQERR